MEINTDNYRIIFTPSNSLLEIYGDIYSDDIYNIFKPLLENLENHTKGMENEIFTININLTGHIGHAAILMLKKIFDIAEKNVNKLILNWHYPENNEELRDLIEDISENYTSADIFIKSKKLS